FQAEDGIRDFHVTGVQTCALPILPTRNRKPQPETKRSRLTLSESRYMAIGGAQIALSPPHTPAVRPTPICHMGPRPTGMRNPDRAWTANTHMTTPIAMTRNDCDMRVMNSAVTNMDTTSATAIHA